MQPNIAALPAELIGSFSGVRPYYDVVYCRSVSPIDRHVRRALRATTVRGKQVGCRYRPRHGVAGYVFRIDIYQPTLATFRLLQQIAEALPRPVARRESRRHCRHRWPLYVSKLEITLDLLVHGPEAAITAGDFIKSHLVQLRSRGLRVGRKARTFYTRPRKHGRSVFAVYDDRKSKVCEDYCVHIEWRATGGPAIRQLGILEPFDLARFSVERFWQRRLVFETLNRESFGKQVLGHRRDIKTTRAHLRASEIILKDRGIADATAQEIRVGLRDCARLENCMIRLDAEPILSRLSDYMRNYPLSPPTTRKADPEFVMDSDGDIVTVRASSSEP